MDLNTIKELSRLDQVTYIVEFVSRKLW